MKDPYLSELQLILNDLEKKEILRIYRAFGAIEKDPFNYQEPNETMKDHVSITDVDSFKKSEVVGWFKAYILKSNNKISELSVQILKKISKAKKRK